MEQLGYYTPPPSDTLRRGKRRAIAAGVLLLVVGAGLALLLLPLLFEILRVRTDRSDFVAMTVAWCGFTSVAICLMALGTGLVRRSRWSRPLTRIAMNVWLTFGASLLAVMYVSTGIDVYQGRHFWLTRIESYIEFGFFVFLAAGLPWLVRWLVEAKSVGAALAHAEFKPRWTDRLHIPRCTVVLNLLTLSLIVAVYDVTALNQQYWNHVDLIVNVGFGLTAALLLASAVLLMINCRYTRPIAIAINIAAFGLCLYFGNSHYAGRFFRYRDTAGTLCFLLCVNAICIMQIWRTGWPEIEEADA